MHHSVRTTPTDLTRATAVKAQLAGLDARSAVLDRLSSRTATLRDDGEAGAVAAEYAMVGGLGAAIIAFIIKVLKDTDFLELLIGALLSLLTKVIEGLFG